MANKKFNIQITGKVNEDNKCIVCKKKLPDWRIRDGNITCSTLCSTTWHHYPKSLRERLRGKKYRNNRIK